MEKTLVFKTATVGGYNKTEVNKYLESVHTELSAYDQELIEKKATIEELEIANEVVQTEISTLKEELAKLEASEKAAKEELEKLKKESETQKKEIKTCLTSLSSKESELSTLKVDAQELMDAKELVIKLQIEAHTTAKRITSTAEAEANELIAIAERKAVELLAIAQKEVDQKKIEQTRVTDETITNLFLLKDKFSEFSKLVNSENENLDKLFSSIKSVK